jgi:hypothetical protein
MNIIATLVFEMAGVIASVLFVQFVILLMRDPHHPAWLNGETAQWIVAVAVVTIGCFSIGLLVAGMVAAGVELYVTLAVSAALPIAVAFVSARVFGFRERLERADAGHSAFFGVAGSGKPPAPSRRSK